MEGKKSAAVVAACSILIIVLLSGQQQQQAAAMSDFCRCYQNCYTECRKTGGIYRCKIECAQDCFNGQPPPSSAAGCREICGLDGICGVMETTAIAADACVASCTNKLGAFAPNAAKINY
ncbi:hypothetical protein HU200_067403 [Digitaria exilis]|uniref:Uncharacterized protein n=1 Tax=Digitaria exilis TaxID=1010633 RepID=A0A834ZVJ9_9POAL|nr:hypothetical protein HU200_067403 [Digitaria exilis]CAB3479497.1 unnamed protein product [Digitaria exilis]